MIGWRVNDSHAEVLARRSFRRYVQYISHVGGAGRPILVAWMYILTQVFAKPVKAGYHGERVFSHPMQ